MNRFHIPAEALENPLPATTAVSIRQRLEQLAELAAVIPARDYRWRKLVDPASGLVSFEVDGHRVLCAIASDEATVEVRRVFRPGAKKPTFGLGWIRRAEPQAA